VLVKDLPAEGNPIYLRVPRRQFYCARCQRYLTERLSGLTANADILADMNQIFTSSGSSLEKVSREENLSFDEIEGIFNHVSKQHLKKLVAS